MFCYGSSRKRIDCPFQVRTHRCVGFGTAFQGPRVARGGPANLEPNAILKRARERPKSWQCKNTRQRAWLCFATHNLKTGTTHAEKMPGEPGSHPAVQDFPTRPAAFHGEGLVPPSPALLLGKRASPCLLWNHPVADIGPNQVQQADTALC